MEKFRPDRVAEAAFAIKSLDHYRVLVGNVAPPHLVYDRFCRD